MSTLNDTDRIMLRQIVAGIVIGFGVIFVGAAAAYSADLAAIAATPGIIWAFVCGAPIEDNTTVPLLIVTGSFSIIIGGILLRFWAK
jgi:hypothetical protein